MRGITTSIWRPDQSPVFGFHPTQTKSILIIKTNRQLSKNPNGSDQSGPVLSHRGWLYTNLHNSGYITICLLIIVEYMSISECDPVQFQAAKALGSLSQKRHALGDITNRSTENVDDALKSPSRAKSKQKPKPLTKAATPRDTSRYDEVQERWLSLKFPAKLAILKNLQAQQHHVFEIENRILSHVGAMTTPLRPTNKRAKGSFTFKFMHEI